MERFSWSDIQTAEVLEESRAARFRPEWRAMLLRYFGLEPGMHVLEVGCGPGTVAPYLAAGIAPGTVTGLDLDRDFIARARAKAASLGLEQVRYVVGDAYALPFADGTFDAVLSYTGIGVLTDPRQAVAEMVRVCRAGGPVSVAEAVAGRGGITFAGVDRLTGQATYPGAERFWQLHDRLTAAHGGGAPGVGSARWPATALWGLMAELGLEELQLDAWGHVMAPDDGRLSAQARLAHRQLEHEQLTGWIDELLDQQDAPGLDRAELLELRRLAATRWAWSRTNPLWDWEASLSLVARGRRPLPDRG